MNPIVRKCLEETNALGPMIVPTIGRRLSRPADNHIVPVPLIECIPVLSVPRII